MRFWGLLFLPWLVTTMSGQDSGRLALQRHSAGWMEPLPTQPEQRLAIGMRPNYHARVSTALFDFGDFASLSRSSAPLVRLYRWFLPNLTLDDTLEHWSLLRPRALQANRRLLLPRRHWQRRSSWIYSRWTKDTGFQWLIDCETGVLLFQDRSSLDQDCQTSSPSGALHSARCWRFTSARCCAPSETHVRIGLTGIHPHLQCAASSPLTHPHLGLWSCKQVLPLSPSVAASWACLDRPGVTPPGMGSAWGCSPSGLQLQGLFPAWIQTLLAVAAPTWTLAHPICHTAAGSRANAPKGPCTTTAIQTLTLTVGPQLLRCSQASPALNDHWTSGHTFPHFGSFRTLGTGVPSFEPDWHGLVTCGDSTGAPVSCMGKRGKRAGRRRRRPRDTEREAHRPPKHLRTARAAGEASDSSYDSLEGSDTDAAPGSARPLTVFSVGAAGMALTSSPASGSQHTVPEPSAESAAQAFNVSDLRVERSPEEFMAIAAALGRHYAAPALAPVPVPASTSADTVSASRSLVPPLTPARGHTGGRHWPAGAMPPSPGPSRPAVCAPLRSEPSARERLPARSVRPQLQPRKPPVGARIQTESPQAVHSARPFAVPTPKMSGTKRPATGVPAVDVENPAVSIEVGGTDRGFHISGTASAIVSTTAVELSEPRPPVREYAEPRPKVRARDRTRPDLTIEDPGAVIQAPTEGSTMEPSTHPTPPGDRQSTAGESVVTAVSETPAEEGPGLLEDAGPRAPEDSVADNRAHPAPLVVEATSDGGGGDTSQAVATSVDQGAAEPEPPCAAEALGSSSDEDSDDFVLMRLRRRGDLPVKIRTSTGLPSGVASLRRDQPTGRVRVVCPPGFSIAHRGTILATAVGNPLFLDEISGFESRPDAQQPYMQGWLGSGFAVRFRCPFPFNRIPVLRSLLTIMLAPNATTALTPLCSLPLPWLYAVPSPLTYHASVSPLYRRRCPWCGRRPESLCEPCGCRCPSVPLHSPVALAFLCTYKDAIGGSQGCRLLQRASPTPGFVSVAFLCPSQPSQCNGDTRRIGQSRLLRLYASATAPPGCHAQCPPRQLQLRLPVRRFNVHGLAYSYRSPHSQSGSLWFLVRQPLWHVPTLLKNRRFCRHPWARRPRRTHQVSSRGADRCRPPIVSPRQQRAKPHGVILVPIEFHFWDFWTACSQILGHHMTGGARCAAVPGGALGPYLRSLACSHDCMRFLSACLDTHTPHTLPNCTTTSDFPCMGTHCFARETFHSSHSMQGSPGPKSGRCSGTTGCRSLSSVGLLLFHIHAACATTTSDARVPLASQVSGEAGSASLAPRQAPAKPLGTQDATCRSPLPSMQRQQIVKRSLQRVHRRIMRTGGAWYKGRWYNQATASALTNRLHQQQTHAPGTSAPHANHVDSRAHVHSATTHPPSQSPRHLQVYTWNVGGLGGGLYDEILYYIHRHPIDVLVIQETKWRFTSRWDTHQYFFVHSGSSAADFKQGGLLTIVAKKLVDPGTLRYVDPLPGRLLRVQFYKHSQPCDVLNFYQHTWRATDHVRRLRTQALDQLTRAIHMIPKRSLMIIGGDFNATCVHSAPHVGRYVMERSHLWATDHEDLQALILGLNLCALNTFQSRHPLHTYMWGTQQSQIDYLFVRCDMADGLSRQSYAMHDHPLGAWRGGARHFLVHAQVPTHWRPWSGHASPSAAPAVDRHAIADALSGKADPRIQAFRMDVQSALTLAPASISELHDTVHTLALKHFPKQVPVRGPRPWQDGTLQQYASRMWGHLRSLRRWAARKDAHSNLQALFQCWRHSVLHLRMHCDARQQGRELRKQRRLSLLSDADKAIQQGQSRQFYQLIDKLAPKGRFRKFQMCKGGDLLTPAEELEVMRKHFVQIFNHDHPGDSDTSSTHNVEGADPSFPVCHHELQVFLDKLPARKAGAPSTAPGAVWRACSDLISPILAGLLNQRWAHPPLTPPEPWARATLSLLLKPHKSGSAPKDFRPIGLLDALGKASISMLMSKMRADLEAYIRTSPQFAYLTGRSTSDALRRVYVHNSAARAMRLPSTRDPHYKRAGGKPVALQGALQVCLDLTSAFDFVPRHLIAEALQDAGITGAPAQLLLSWLQACSYDLYVEGQCAHIPTNRGVKQGCPASPLLFAAFMTLITRRLSSRLTAEWVAQYLTMFADDFHVGKCFQGYHELETFSAQIGFIITTLRKHGMSVHATKAQAILILLRAPSAAK